MTIEMITEKIQEKVSSAPDMKATAKLNFGEDGVIFIDNKVSPPEISNEDRDADVELVCSIETFEKILNGTQDPNIAFMMGKLKIKGSMGLAMQLNAMLED